MAIRWANLGTVELLRGRLRAGRRGLLQALTLARESGMKRLWTGVSIQLAATDPETADGTIAQLAEPWDHDPRIRGAARVYRGLEDAPLPAEPGFTEAVVAGLLQSAQTVSRTGTRTGSREGSRGRTRSR